MPAKVRVEGLRVVHLADAAFCLFLAPVEGNFRQQRNGLVIVLEAFDELPLGKLRLVVEVVLVNHLFDLQLSVERAELFFTQIASLGFGVIGREQLLAILE